ncbi:MAG: ring-cleaving dioxygenase [Spirochaetaceae bacterium]
MTPVIGIHHITAIAGGPQENLDFYVGVLGLKLVKQSINQDVPDTYHLFFADGEGHPGTDLTFFPWPQMGPGRLGAGVWGEVSFAVPPGSLDFWQERLRAAGVSVGERETRFDEAVLPFTDPHGMHLALAETHTYGEQPFTPVPDTDVPEEHQIRALSSVRLVTRSADATASFLCTAYGFSAARAEGAWTRYTVGEGLAGQRIDIRVDPEAPRGSWGTGSVHHVAFRVADTEAQAAVRRQILEAGAAPTKVIDRFWFKSVYTQAPAGVICEVATDGPGFAVDEDPARLGRTLVLPPWFERRRSTIESLLPPLRMPDRSAAQQAS